MVSRQPLDFELLHGDSMTASYSSTFFALAFSTLSLHAQELLFQDDFKGTLGPGWSWVREHRQTWRATERGLEVRLEPGNMWGPENNAKNVLLRPAPNPATNDVEVS